MSAMPDGLAWFMLFGSVFSAVAVVFFICYAVIFFRRREVFFTASCSMLVILTSAASVILGHGAGVGFEWWMW